MYAEMLPKLRSLLFSAFGKAFNLFLGTGIGKIPAVRAVYHFLYRVLWSNKNIIEVHGSKMYIDLNDKNPALQETFRSYSLLSEFEPSTTKIFEKVVKKGDTVVDLGANIGYFTLLAAKLVGKEGKVYSFEPEPRNYNYLLKNIEINGYSNVVAVQKAVSDKTGKTKLYICPYDSGHHTINQYDGIKAYNPDFIGDKKEFVEVEMVTLDDFFEAKNLSIDVMKMDVEGAEMLALLGMDRVIKESGKLKMFVEFFPLLIREMGGSPEEFIRRFLEDYHFSMFIIPGDYDASKKGIKINNADELMRFCKGERSHVNLFLRKSGDENDGGISP